jgi:uncharacterized protein YndB with AHSA1/START domain
MENPQTRSAALVVKRTMPFPPEALYKAFSDPKVMSKWFFADRGGSSHVTNDFRLGGEFAIDMRSDKDVLFPHRGVYKEIVVGEKLSFTWNSPFATDSLVTLLFKKVKDGTELTLTHEFLAEDQRENHRGGWKGCLDHLEAFLKG